MDATTYRKAEFDQSQYLDQTRNPASAGGGCHCFAMAWANEILSDKSLGSGHRMDRMAKRAPEVRILFKAMGDRWKHEGESGADAGVAKRLGVQIDQVVNCGNFALVANKVREEHRAAFLYSFWFSNGGAHTIAFYRSGKSIGGHVYAFDPNYGEYKMQKSQLIGWLTGFINVVYANFGTITRHRLTYVSPYTASAVKFGVAV